MGGEGDEFLFPFSCLVDTESNGNAHMYLRNTETMNKALGETQTLRAGCSKAKPKIFARPQTPSGGRMVVKIYY